MQIKKVAIYLLILSALLAVALAQEADSTGYYLQKVAPLINKAKEDSLRIYCQKGIMAAQKENRMQAQIRFLNLLASTYSYSDKEKAISLLRQVLKVSEKEDYEIGIMLATSQLSMHSRWKGQYDSAFHYLERSKTILDKQEAGRKKNLAFASLYNSKGKLYHETGQLDLALKNYYQAIKLAELEKVPHSIATYQYNVAETHFVLAEYTEAKNVLQSCMSYAESAENNQISSWCYTLMGQIALKEQEPDSAIIYYRKSLSLAKKEKNSSERTVLMRLSEALLESGQLDSAGFIAERLYEYVSEDDFSLMTQINLLEGRIFLERNQYASAISTLEKAEEISRNIGDLDLELSSLELLIRAYQSFGDLKSAISLYPRFLEVSQSILNKEKIASMKELNTIYETEKKDQQIQVLAQQNEIKDLQISQQRIVLLSSVAGFLLLGGLGYFAVRQRKLQSDQRQLVLEQSLLRAQMNPHFIFNALNSIQNFITSNQNDEATLYLAKFGELTRDILEASSENWILLEKELKIIQNYLELERARFQKELQLEVNMALEDSDYLLVPPMIVQPFLENSIKHGFSEKKEGSIKLSFRELAGWVHVVIEDDGSGLKKPDKSHRSRAIEITNKRLVNISKEKDNRVQVSNKEKDGVISGAIVKFKFPANYAI